MHACLHAWMHIGPSISETGTCATTVSITRVDVGGGPQPMAGGDAETARNAEYRRKWTTTSGKARQGGREKLIAKVHGERRSKEAVLAERNAQAKKKARQEKAAATPAANKEAAKKRALRSHLANIHAVSDCHSLC